MIAVEEAAKDVATRTASVAVDAGALAMERVDLKSEPEKIQAKVAVVIQEAVVEDALHADFALHNNLCLGQTENHVQLQRFQNLSSARLELQ